MFWPLVAAFWFIVALCLFVLLVGATEAEPDPQTPDGQRVRELTAQVANLKTENLELADKLDETERESKRLRLELARAHKYRRDVMHLSQLHEPVVADAAGVERAG